MPAKVKGIKQRVQEQNLSTMRLVVRIAQLFCPTAWRPGLTLLLDPCFINTMDFALLYYTCSGNDCYQSQKKGLGNKDAYGKRDKYQRDTKKKEFIESLHTVELFHLDVEHSN